MTLPTVYKKFIRNIEPGMGQAVAERTILRKKDNELETWKDVAERVSLGNSLLCTTIEEQQQEKAEMFHHISKATILMSGRHLQHGDETQPNRNMEVYTNCATSATSFILFYLLLNGSGVGRAYDDDMMLVNWDNMPNIKCVLSDTHKDFDFSAHESVRDALHKYGKKSDKVKWFTVEDTREWWAKVVEIIEVSAFQKIYKDFLFIFDFSQVRCKGSLIGGMQNRPASGPVPLIDALQKCASIKGSNLEPWKQAMYVDHYLAACVLFGGARRSARMSTKTWRDENILEYIQIKRPIEYVGLSVDEVAEYRKKNNQYGFLWSSNNSITVDSEFWRLLSIGTKDDEYNSDLAAHARKVFKMLCACSYGDGTGEPGIINQDKLAMNNHGWENLNLGDFVGSKRYQVHDDTQILLSKLAKRAKKKKYNMITNPCGEIALNMLGGFCVLADVVPFHADTLDEAENAFRVATRSLIRVNTMDSIYRNEVKRTNRIGVGITGIHEFAWKFFKLGFRDLIDEEKSKNFWETLQRFNNAVVDEAISYSKKIGASNPHTCTTEKPAGTTSKIFGLTEGWHLPSLAYYLRWVQFRNDDPMVEEYKKLGYPIKKLVQYEGTTVVGFPTVPTIASMGLGDKLVTAGEATPEEQYKWLQLGEKYWIAGVTNAEYGNQISYTLKYQPDKVSHKDFTAMLKKYQSQIKCCAVMPQENMISFEYQPEEPITKAQYEDIIRKIQTTDIKEDVDFAHIKCDNGACPIDFDKAQVIIQ